MQNPIKFITLLFLCAMVSCTDVIDVDVQTDTIRLVVEASLDWEKGTTGNEQTITLRTSTPFFDTQSTDVVGAQVSVTNDVNGEVYLFTDQADGTYTTDTLMMKPLNYILFLMILKRKGIITFLSMKDRKIFYQY